VLLGSNVLRRMYERVGVEGIRALRSRVEPGSEGDEWLRVLDLYRMVDLGSHRVGVDMPAGGVPLGYAKISSTSRITLPARSRTRVPVTMLKWWNQSQELKGLYQGMFCSYLPFARFGKVERRL
jgi:hypothetical protein